MTLTAEPPTTTLPGRVPLGATPLLGGTNFAVSPEVANVAEAVVRCLFDAAGDETDRPSSHDSADHVPRCPVVDPAFDWHDSDRRRTALDHRPPRPDTGGGESAANDDLTPTDLPAHPHQHNQERAQ